jgi:hypothetical protein
MVFEKEIAAAEAAAERAAKAADEARENLRRLHEQESRVAQWPEPPRGNGLTVILYVDFFTTTGEADSMIVRCWSWSNGVNWQYVCPNISVRGLQPWSQLIKAMTGGPRDRHITGIDVVSKNLVFSLAEYLKATQKEAS